MDLRVYKNVLIVNLYSLNFWTVLYSLCDSFTDIYNNQAVEHTSDRWHFQTHMHRLHRLALSSIFLLMKSYLTKNIYLEDFILYSVKFSN